jgi:hypothetical protein
VLGMGVRRSRMPGMIRKIIEVFSENSV